MTTKILKDSFEYIIKNPYNNNFQIYYHHPELIDFVPTITLYNTNDNQPNKYEYSDYKMHKIAQYIMNKYYK